MLLEDYEHIIDEVAKINEDEDIPVSKPDVPAPEEHHEEQPVEHEESQQPADARSAIRQAMEPQVEIARAVEGAISDLLADDCNKQKKIGVSEDRIKSIEKTLRGACEQIVAIVEGKNFQPDKHNSNPKAWKWIRHSDSRDQDVVKLATAIITFYNSLG